MTNSNNKEEQVKAVKGYALVDDQGISTVRLTELAIKDVQLMHGGEVIEVLITPVSSKERDVVNEAIQALEGGKQIDGVSCNGSWAAEQARASLGAKEWECISPSPAKQEEPTPDPSQTSDIEALRWMLERQAIVDTDMAHDPSQRYVVWAVDWTGIVSKIKLAEGLSELEAIRNAMANEKGASK